MMVTSKSLLAGAALIALSLQSSAGAAEPHYTMADFYRVAKIDTHMHLHSTRPNFMREAERDRFRVLSINVDYADFPPIDEQQRKRPAPHNRFVVHIRAARKKDIGRPNAGAENQERDHRLPPTGPFPV